MTQSFSLTNAAWTDLGPTPCVVENVGDAGALVAIGTSMPGTLNAAAHELAVSKGEGGWTISALGQRAYARAQVAATIVDVSPAGGGSSTLADGADATEGARADAQATDDTGSWSVVSLLKRISAGIPSTIAAVNSTAPALDGFAVTLSDTLNFSTNARALYVGSGGDVALVTPAGSVLLHKNVPAGVTLAIGARRVNATGTTASNLIGYV